MADEQGTEVAEGTPAKQSSQRRNVIFGVILLVVMAVEGVAAVVLVKHFGPDPASVEASGGKGLDASDGEPVAELVELEVSSFRAENEGTRQLLMWDLVVWASVKKENASAFEKLVRDRPATIKDRLSSVIRGADPKVLSEPDRSTLRQQIHRELNAIVGDEETIQEVLIPTMIPYGG